MNISITGRHFEVSDALREYINEKVKRLDRSYDGINELEVLLKAEDRALHCEFILHIKNKPSIVIDVAQETIYAAIDLATDKAQRQLSRHKERIKDHRPNDSSAS